MAFSRSMIQSPSSLQIETGSKKSPGGGHRGVVLETALFASASALEFQKFLSFAPGPSTWDFTFSKRRVLFLVSQCRQARTSALHRHFNWRTGDQTVPILQRQNGRGGVGQDGSSLRFGRQTDPNQLALGGTLRARDPTGFRKSGLASPNCRGATRLFRTLSHP